MLDSKNGLHSGESFEVCLVVGYVERWSGLNNFFFPTGNMLTWCAKVVVKVLP